MEAIVILVAVFGIAAMIFRLSMALGWQADRDPDGGWWSVPAAPEPAVVVPIIEEPVEMTIDSLAA